MAISTTGVSTLGKTGGTQLAGPVTLTEGSGVTITQSGQALTIAAAGFSYGASISGTTADGVTITLNNTSDDGAAAIKLVAGNTQSNQPLLANLQIGTSANVMGILIQGTGGNTGGAAGAGLNHMTLWANVASSTVKALSIGNGTSYTERTYLAANGDASLANGRCTITASGIFMNSINATVQLQPTSGATLFVADGSSMTGTGTEMRYLTMNAPSSNNGWGGITAAFTDPGASSNGGAQSYFINADVTQTMTDASNNTDFAGLFWTQRVASANTRTVTSSVLSVNRTSVTANGSANFTQSGPLLNVRQVATQTSGTLLVTGPLVRVTAPASSASFTADLLQLVNNATTNLRFTATGNLCLGAAAAGSSAANGVLALGNGATAPSNSVDLAQLYSVDLSAGNATLGIATERAVAADIAVASTNSLSIVINGSTYKLLLAT